MRKVLVIGLDGAVPRFVFDLWRNDLPNLTALAETGVWGDLRSVHPPITVPAWTCMTSGRDPGELGLYGFRNRRSRDYDDHFIASARDVRFERIWDSVSDAGGYAVVLGVPQTYPPKPLRGSMVSCFLTPSRDSRYTYPDALQREIDQVAGGYVLDVDGFRTDGKAELLERIYEKTRKHFVVARHLLQTRPWDFFMMVEMGVDRIHHGFWQYCDSEHPKFEPHNPFREAIREYYRYVDTEVGHLVSLAPPDAAVVVVSDHGGRAMKGGFCLNEWLLRRGDLTLLERPRVPQAFDAKLVDWSRTRIWGDGGYYGRLFLNVRDREPRGAVARGDYEMLRDEIIGAIEALEGPDGKSLEARAYRPEELYADVTGVAPDILAYFGDLAWRSVGSVGAGGLYTTDNDTGPDGANHDWDGMFLLRRGRENLGGRRIDGLQMTDVAGILRREIGLSESTIEPERRTGAAAMLHAAAASAPSHRREAAK